jgi:hypothetical protein
VSVGNGETSSIADDCHKRKRNYKSLSQDESYGRGDDRMKFSAIFISTAVLRRDEKRLDCGLSHAEIEAISYFLLHGIANGTIVRDLSMYHERAGD